jgi:hypothetical protein
MVHNRKCLREPPSNGNIELAMKLIKSGSSIRFAAKTYGVHDSTV